MIVEFFGGPLDGTYDEMDSTDVAAVAIVANSLGVVTERHLYKRIPKKGNQMHYKQDIQGIVKNLQDLGLL